MAKCARSPRCDFVAETLRILPQNQKSRAIVHLYGIPSKLTGRSKITVCPSSQMQFPEAMTRLPSPGPASIRAIAPTPMLFKHPIFD
ncbi:MAG: hypothetical protein ACAF42_13310 [Limnothrix sp. BL-A-16]